MKAKLMLNEVPGHIASRKRASDWPLAPFLMLSMLLIFLWSVGRSHAWSADLAALLLAFSIARSVLCLTQSWQGLSTPAARWAVLVSGLTLALVAGVALEQRLWPALSVPHAYWVMPLILLGFLLLTILPDAINNEVMFKAEARLLAEENRHRTERQLLEAKLAALQGQIEPHFLYNTLANVRALVKQDALAAEHMLHHLITYLRAAMPDLRAPTTTLGQELERADAYLRIMQLRLGERLRFSISATAQARACLIPPLALMSLVENAIKHGIEPQLAGGTVTVDALCQNAFLLIKVSDDGAGFQAEGGDGIGLLNLQQRMLALFGESAELSLSAGTVSGIEACIKLPIHMEKIV
jgi:signal transduction histidine kinase